MCMDIKRVHTSRILLYLVYIEWIIFKLLWLAIFINQVMFELALKILYKVLIWFRETKRVYNSIPFFIDSILTLTSSKTNICKESICVQKKWVQFKKSWSSKLLIDNISFSMIHYRYCICYINHTLQTIIH